MLRDVVHELRLLVAGRGGIARDSIARPGVAVAIALGGIDVDDDHRAVRAEVPPEVHQPLDRLAEVVERVDDNHQLEVLAGEARVVRPSPSTVWTFASCWRLALASSELSARRLMSLA